MGKKRILFMALFLTFFLCAVRAMEKVIPLSTQQRKSLVLVRKMVPDADNKFDYYVSKELVKYKDGVRQLVFVDEIPLAGWEHPCKYIYVDPENPTVESSIVVEAKYPPKGVRLVPAIKKNGVSEDLVEINVETGPENKAAQHTYAVIISGGKDKESNSARYWNDCSFIYQTLTKRYRVPKSNVKVLMSDGTDPADDMCDEIGGSYMSSPLDLDGDGAADIQYSATKANVKNVIEGLTSSLGANDHLFLFFVDHGGYDKTRRLSYVCLWNGEKLYPAELNGYLSHGDAGYVSVLMGQCNSGGFTGALKADGRIIMTACGANEFSYSCEELPFDEFVYRWTSAINGSDAFGNAVDAGRRKGFTPLVNAYSYACENDIYVNGDFGYAMETPSVSYLENSTAEDLAMNAVPDVVDLYITRGEIQTEDTLKLVTKKGSINIPKDMVFTDRAKTFWDSSDIWVRHKNDGMTNHTHESGPLDGNSNTYYIYANIRNRGVRTYSSGDEILKFYWARSSMKITRDVWLGNKSSRKDEVYGSPGSWDYIDDEIPAGGSAIVGLDITFSNGYLTLARKEDFNLCILAFLSKEGDDGFLVDSLQIPAVWNTNKLAQKNLTNMDIDSRYDGELKQEKLSSVLLPYDKEPKEYRLRMLPSKNTEKLLKDTRITLNVPAGAIKEWYPVIMENGVARAYGNADLTKVAMNDKLMVDNIMLTGSKACKISIGAAVNASDELVDSCEYKFDLALYDAKNDLLLGGESYRIMRGPRKKIDFSVNKELNSGKYEMTASDASEDVNYEWYDSDGNLVASGTTCEVPANVADGTYRVVASATADNAYCEKTVNVSRISKITDVTAKSDGSVEVMFSSPVEKGTSVQVSACDGSVPSTGCDVAEGSARCSINAKALKSGVYQLNLIENGKTTESRKFVKRQ